MYQPSSNHHSSVLCEVELMLMFAETGRHAQARTQSPDKSEVIGSSVGLVPSNAHAVRGVSPSKATLVDLFEAARKIVCIPGDESERHDSSFSRPTVRTGSRGYDRWVVTTSRSVYGDGRHNRGLIALFVVIIHCCSAARGRRSLCTRRFCGRMRSCSKN